MPSSNTIITPSIIAKEALFQLRNNLVMGNLVYRDYKKEFRKVGDTVTIRKPVQFTASNGATRVIQNVVETSTSIKVDQQKHVSWDFSMKDLTLSVEEYSTRYIVPAAVALAQQVDADLCTLYKDIYLASGTAGTTPNAYSNFGAAAQKMSEFAVPYNDRKCVTNPAAHWSMADALKGVFEPNRVKGIIEKGVIGNVAGFDTFEDQNIMQHVAGVPGGSPVVNTSTGITSGSANIAITAAANSQTPAYKKGDVITIVGVNAVNPKSKADLGYLMQFVFTADANSDGSGNVTAIVSPTPVTAAGAYQNCVVNSAGAGKAVVLLANHSANLCFHPNTFALVMVPLEVPDGAAFKAQESYENLSITVVKDFDITNYVDIIRLDILYGVKTVYPDLGLRLLG
jgi:hypothetical protein